jgi:hypothetical protein
MECLRKCHGGVASIMGCTPLHMVPADSVYHMPMVYNACDMVSALDLQQSPMGLLG